MCHRVVCSSLWREQYDFEVGVAFLRCASSIPRKLAVSHTGVCDSSGRIPGAVGQRGLTEGCGGDLPPVLLGGE